MHSLRLKFGAIQLTVHEGKLVQVDVTERKRFRQLITIFPRNLKAQTGPPDASLFTCIEIGNRYATLIPKRCCSPLAFITLALAFATPAFAQTTDDAADRNGQMLRLTDRQPPPGPAHTDAPERCYHRYRTTASGNCAGNSDSRVGRWRRAYRQYRQLQRRPLAAIDADAAILFIQPAQYCGQHSRHRRAVRVNQ